MTFLTGHLPTKIFYAFLMPMWKTWKCLEKVQIKAIPDVSNLAPCLSSIHGRIPHSESVTSNLNYASSSTSIPPFHRFSSPFSHIWIYFLVKYTFRLQANKKDPSTSWKQRPLFKKTGVFSSSLFFMSYKTQHIISRSFLWCCFELSGMPRYSPCPVSHNYFCEYMWSGSSYVTRWNYPKCFIAPAPKIIWWRGGKFSW